MKKILFIATITAFMTSCNHSGSSNGKDSIGENNSVLDTTQPMPGDTNPTNINRKRGNYRLANPVHVRDSEENKSVSESTEKNMSDSSTKEKITEKAGEEVLKTLKKFVK